MEHTSEQIARRIMDLLDERHTKPSEHDMFGAIKARLVNEDIQGEELDGGVRLAPRADVNLKGPRIWRTAVLSTSKA